MRLLTEVSVSEVSLPWSDGLLSARISHKGNRTIAGVPELGLHCYGNSQAEAVFRLFTTLLKYYRQLKTVKGKLSTKGQLHIALLSLWVEAIENKMKIRTDDNNVVAIAARSFRR